MITRILNLIEDTPGTAGCAAEHGLSFYIETETHRILADLGPSAAALDNARSLGVDLNGVDTVFLSHGHYDHAGGILPFSRVNAQAAIYLQENAAGPYYAWDGPAEDACRTDESAGGYRYIGIDPAIMRLPQVIPVKGDLTIDGELSLITIDRDRYPIPSANRTILEKRPEGWARDNFKHELALAVRDGDGYVLFSGCAHSGILNVMATCERKVGTPPRAVFSGFHLQKKTAYTEEEREEIRAIARRLLGWDTVYYTCHCTGLSAFALMKEIMGDKIRYVHTGETIDIER